MRAFITLIFAVLFTTISFGQSSYVRKANRAVENNKLDLAKEYYLKACASDKNDYAANLGLGFMLADIEHKYSEALPYLEKALAKSPVDTFPDFLFTLAKTYQQVGQFEKAENIFSRLIVVATEDKEDDLLYTMDLKKNEQDCIFARKNLDSVYNKNVYVSNLGPNINTAMAEYVPVLISNTDIVFTSRRKDSEKEKVSKVDGKYYENMYISKMINGKPQQVKVYVLVDKAIKTKFDKKHVSIVSSSYDGKTIFLFQDNKIHEVSVNSDDNNSSKLMPKNINIDYYQNHATVSKDGKMLLFTSEDERGIGGLDIYKSLKADDGTWSIPENLGKTINTPFDEDSPFLSEDGQTLYFSSKGHPGFGNYDIYKSTFVNGTWSQPENLGQPINSPGHDIFMIESKDGANGYFSSSRAGGYGDMDIYKVSYLDKVNKECAEATSPLVQIKATMMDTTTKNVQFTANANSSLNVLSYDWQLNDTKLTESTSSITKPVSYTEIGDSVYVKLVVGCDTCIDPLVICNYTKFQKPKVEIAVSTDTNVIAANNTSETNNVGEANKYEDESETKNQKENNKTYLSKAEIDALGFNLSPIHFSLNKSNIREDATEILKSNIQVLSSHPELKVIIYGFADTRGSSAYNMMLSKQRAKHVRDYLVSNGVKSKQIHSVIGKGEGFVLNKCVEGVECNEEEHEVNRRAEFIIFKSKK
jgi:outer membrane protein OmpA-like peptidoglycan-associated protein/tetratricopeptide (TPR) repeat protein